MILNFGAFFQFSNIFWAPQTFFEHLKHFFGHLKHFWTCCSNYSKVSIFHEKLPSRHDLCGIYFLCTLSGMVCLDILRLKFHNSVPNRLYRSQLLEKFVTRAVTFLWFVSIWSQRIFNAHFRYQYNYLLWHMTTFQFTYIQRCTCRFLFFRGWFFSVPIYLKSFTCVDCCWGSVLIYWDTLHCVNY